MSTRLADGRARAKALVSARRDQVGRQSEGADLVAGNQLQEVYPMPVVQSILRAPLVQSSVAVTPGAAPSPSGAGQPRIPAGQPGGGRFHREPIPLPERLGGPAPQITPLPPPPPLPPKLPAAPAPHARPLIGTPQAVPGNLPVEDVNKLRQGNSPQFQRQVDQLGQQMQRQQQELRATSAAYDRAVRPPPGRPTPSPSSPIPSPGSSLAKRILGTALKVVGTVLGGYAAFKIVTESKSVIEFIKNTASLAVDVAKNRLAGPVVYLAKEVAEEAVEPLIVPARDLLIEYLYGPVVGAEVHRFIEGTLPVQSAEPDNARLRVLQQEFDEVHARLIEIVQRNTILRAESASRFYDLILAQIEEAEVTGPIHDC